MKNNINISEIKTARRDAVRSFSNNAYTFTSQVLVSVCKTDNPEAEAAIENCREYDFRSKNNSLAKSDVQSHIEHVTSKLEAVGYVGDVDVYYDERVVCYESLTERNKTLKGEWHCEPIDEEEVSVVVATFSVGKVEEKAEEFAEENGLTGSEWAIEEATHMTKTKHIETKGNCTLIEKDGCFIMTNEATTMTHAISSKEDITTPERLAAHWEGFLADNLDAVTLENLNAIQKSDTKKN